MVSSLSRPDPVYFLKHFSPLRISMATLATSVADDYAVTVVVSFYNHYLERICLTFFEDQVLFMLTKQFAYITTILRPVEVLHQHISVLNSISECALLISPRMLSR